MTHPSRRLDDAVHQRTRLGILAVLCESGSVEFTFLRESLELTDGNLSRNLTRLEEAGYARITKRSGRHGTRTWINATDDGRRALQQEIAALEELIARVRPEAAPKLRRAARPATT
jgi:DNA-binding MarR family transcriptional regulator